MRMDKTIAHYESYGKTDHNNERNIRDYDMSCWKQKNMCQHEKLHPLTARRLKWISETMYRDIEK